MHYLDMMGRADRAYHDVAQLHLHEFDVEGDPDLYPVVGEGDGSRARESARDKPPHTSPPPLHTDSESNRRPGIQGVCTPGESE